MANPTVKSPNSNRSNQFGSFPQTPNRQWINGWQNYFITEDATATPNTSPLSVANNADTVLKIPQGATQLVLYSSVALRINDLSPASAPYFVIPATTVFTVPCSTPSNDPTDSSSVSFYLRGDAASATVQFMFLCV